MEEILRVYPNVFGEIGVSEQEAHKRLEDSFEEVFFGKERIYHEDGSLGYMVDTGNNDVRTEGQSYGMMIAVQMDRKDVFERIWQWTKKYMLLTDGEDAGYFGWSARLDGVRNSDGPAPDGEEYFAMSLIFAARRWERSDYLEDAHAILRAMVRNKHPMFDPVRKLIKFTPLANFSDPSYHLPHFYELFALWGEEKDFFAEAAKASREYLQKAINAETGLSAEYAEYDGTPRNVRNHNLFYSDAYRTIANVALDGIWFPEDGKWRTERANAIQAFFGKTDRGNTVFHIDGTPAADNELVSEADGRPKGVLHPIGLLATLAQASLVSNDNYRLLFVKEFWRTPLRSGNRRYYDNLLYIFALMSLSGNYKIW